MPATVLAGKESAPQTQYRGDTKKKKKKKKKSKTIAEMGSKSSY